MSFSIFLNGLLSLCVSLSLRFFARLCSCRREVLHELDRESKIAMQSNKKLMKSVQFHEHTTSQLQSTNELLLVCCW